MPNHVTNELIFRATPARQKLVLSNAVNDEGDVDFRILVPYPLTAWLGSVGSEHKRLGEDGLAWASRVWGTKWNAYDCKPADAKDDALTLRFSTAWSPPYGWLVALLNTVQLPFEHNWLSEGESWGHSATWDWDGKDRGPFMAGPRWKEVTCSEEMQKHLHVLRWGCESFPGEDEEVSNANQL